MVLTNKWRVGLDHRTDEIAGPIFLESAVGGFLAARST
jgi:hypothetical protein